MKTPYKKSGFTLLEVLISTILFCVIAMGAAYPLSSMKRSAIGGDEKLQASLIIETKMAEVRRQYLLTGEIKTASGTTTPETQFAKLEMPAATEFQIGCFEPSSTEAVPVLCDPNITQGLRKLVVQLDWVNRTGESKQMQLITYVYR